jgi:copper chaperone CopZ
MVLENRFPYGSKECSSAPLGQDRRAVMKTEKLSIEGMYCGHCAALIKKSISIVNGVEDAEVGPGSATVVYDESITDREIIEKAVTRFGYKVKD